MAGRAKNGSGTHMRELTPRRTRCRCRAPVRLLMLPPLLGRVHQRVGSSESANVFRMATPRSNAKLVQRFRRRP
jgi:hypothetical protein